MAFSSALSIGIALLIAMLLVVVAANINRFTNSIEEELVIQASISPTLAESSKESLREQIAQIDGIESVQFSSKEEELDKLIQENGDVFSRYAEEGRNPLYDIYIIEVRDPEHIDEISAAVEEIPGINAVNYGGG
ncbi:permease-like cell division protein FtsX, partial [uncultured Dubosiella sp.]